MSPFEAYHKAIEAGWTKTEIDPTAFITAFSTEQRRVVDRGCIKFKGEFWTCDGLQSCLDDYVTVLIPKYQSCDRLVIKDDRGRLIGVASRDKEFHPLDPAGAREAAARGGRRVKAVRKLERSIPTIDPVADVIDFARKLPRPPVAPIGARIGASDEARAIAESVKETPAERRAREQAALKRADEASQEFTRRLQQNKKEVS